MYIFRVRQQDCHGCGRGEIAKIDSFDRFGYFTHAIGTDSRYPELVPNWILRSDGLNPFLYEIAADRVFLSSVPGSHQVMR